MSIKPATLWLSLWLVFLCGQGRVDAQYGHYRVTARQQAPASDLARLPSTTENLSPSGLTRYVSHSAEAPETSPGDRRVAGPDTAGQMSPGLPESSLGTSGNGAAPVIPPGPVASGDLMNWSPGNVDYLSPYMVQSPELHGFFFQYDHLVWTITAPAIERFADAQFTFENELYSCTSNIKTDVYSGCAHSGERFDFGHMEGDLGWFSSILFGQGTRSAIGSGGSHVIHFDDPQEEDYAANSLHATEKIQLSGAELNRAVRCTPNWEYFYGIRYADLRQWYSLDVSGGLVSPSAVRTEAKNHIIAPQLGSRFTVAAYKLIVNAEGRFALGYNYQTLAQTGFLGLESALVDPIAQTDYFRAEDNDEFSILTEHRIEGILPVNRFVALRFGYTGMLMGGVSYASPRVIYFWPNHGPRDVASDETVYVAAFTVGLEVNR
jgi:hypothetical protein